MAFYYVMSSIVLTNGLKNVQGILNNLLAAK
jgi:hypothetical protein